MSGIAEPRSRRSVDLFVLMGFRVWGLGFTVAVAIF